MTESLSEVAARFRIARLAEIAVNDSRFSQVEYMVEADDFAYQALWNAWHDRIDWQSDTSGRMVGLGILIGRAVNVDVRFAHINGHLVMFYWGSSTLVDHDMVERFVADVRKLAAEANPGRKPAGKTDAANFVQCVHFDY
jgi:hypothetical protein